MNNKISGEDIFLAIGEIDEKLLEYPKEKPRAVRFIKPLTLAASLILCLSVVFSYVFNVMLGGAKSEDMSNMEGMGSSSAPGASGNSAEKNDCTAVIITLSSIASDVIASTDLTEEILLDANNSLQIKPDADGEFTVYIPKEITNEYVINVSRIGGNAEALSNSTETGDFLKYKVSAEGLSEISFEKDGSVYRISVTDAGGGYIRLTSVARGLAQ